MAGGLRLNEERVGADNSGSEETNFKKSIFNEFIIIIHFIYRVSLK